MIAAQSRHLKLTQGPLTLAVLVRVLLEPTIAVGTLVAAAAWYGVPFGGAYLILALLVFSLTFPGRAPRATGAGGLARDVAASWILTVALLVTLGWATRTLGAFDERVLLAWIVAAPAGVFAAQLAVPYILPRVMRSEGVRRVAVIAGAGDLGRQLAERLRGSPLLGVEVAGFFDDRAPERWRKCRTNRCWAR
jgi:putative colanic acid biosynthesis UDP-glucose lipid carrier transferase